MIYVTCKKALQTGRIIHDQCSLSYSLSCQFAPNVPLLKNDWVLKISWPREEMNKHPETRQYLAQLLTKLHEWSTIKSRQESDRLSRDTLWNLRSICNYITHFCFVREDKILAAWWLWTADTMCPGLKYPTSYWLIVPHWMHFSHMYINKP